MKILLSIIGAISIVGASTTSLVACNTPKEYTPKELKELKEKNKINTANQEIRDNLEWIAPQEKPFNKVDNKWYFVVWRRGNKNDYWRIIKLKNDKFPKEIIFNDNVKNKIFINYGEYNYWKQRTKELYFVDRNLLTIKYWSDDRDMVYFKTVYRWNLLDKTEPNLIIDDKDDVKVNNGE